MIVLLTGPPGTGKSTLGELAARELGASVLGWDWVMASLTWCRPVMSAFGELDFEAYRRVGWSVMENLARAQLRHDRSVVLDGVAREPEVTSVRALGQETGAVVRVVVTECSDRELLRERIVTRRREIPGWHELSWSDVEKTLAGWVPPSEPDLVVDTADPEAATRTFLSVMRTR